ncbi:MAG TPA: AraC family transcriptional regulator ligand-binding domain-containing protein [Mesorhizobium sp.]|nr:AraC family transcriptional regulator ligand-binding domain-containing protein [Mesorhizobium sp.]
MAAGLASRLALAQLERHNIDPAPLLARSKLSAAALRGEKRVSVAAQIEFIEEVSRATKDDWIGFTMASDFDLRELGLLYYVAASSRRLEDAFRRVERYVRLGNESLVLRMDKGATYTIGLSYQGAARYLDRHQMEFFALVLLRMCRQLVGKKIVPLGASFVHHRSGDMRQVQRFLGCEPRYDAYSDEIKLEPSLAELPLVGDDPFLNEMMVKHCEDALRARRTNVSPFRTIVENAIAPLLPHAEARAKTIAHRLGLSERTFARRLEAEGLNFGDILDHLRRELALRYLDEGLQASQIAWLLGFHQPSSFSHACRRWTGKTPSEHRRARGVGEPAMA